VSQREAIMAKLLIFTKSKLKTYYSNVKVKVKLPHHRLGQALMFPGGWASQNLYIVGT
jgi:hypothetical protein